MRHDSPVPAESTDHTELQAPDARCDRATAEERQLAVDDLSDQPDVVGGNTCGPDCVAGYISAGGFAVCLGC